MTSSAPENPSAAPTAPAATERQRLFIDCSVVLLLALAVRLAVFFELGGTAFNWHHLPQTTDMYFFVEWARHIKDVDWLVREDFHPYHILPELQRENSLWDPEFIEAIYRPGVYHQAPVYPYLLALIFAATGVSPRAVFLVQHLLGALLAVLLLLSVHIIMEGSPRRRTARLAAGVMTALYGPFVFYEEVLLRASLFAFAGGLALLALLWAEKRGGGRRWLTAGLALGFAYLVRPTVTLLLLLTALVLIVRGVRRIRRGKEPAEGGETTERWGAVRRLRPLLPAAALAGGFLLFNAPVMLRNVLLGAPLLMVEGDPGGAFIQGNYPGYVGHSFGDTPPHYKELMVETRARLWPCVVATLKMYQGRYDRWIGKLFVKLGWAFHWFELPNNTNFYNFRLHSFWLKVCFFTFLIVGPLGVLGLVELWPRRREAYPLYFYIISMLVPLVLIFVLSRLRLALLPGLLIAAGAGTARLRDTLFAPRSSRPAPWPVLLIGGAFLTYYLFQPPYRQEVNSGDFLTLQSIYMGLGRKEDAERTFVEAKEYLLAPQRMIEAPGLYFDLGNMAYDSGQLEEALDFFGKCIHGGALAAECAYNLGAVQHQVGRDDGAVEAFRTALFLTSQPEGMAQRLASALPDLWRRVSTYPPEAPLRLDLEPSSAGGPLAKEEDSEAPETSETVENTGFTRKNGTMAEAVRAFRAKKFAEAARLFAAVPPESPDYGAARKNLARSLYNEARRQEADRPEEALRLLDEALRIDRYLFLAYRDKAILEAETLGDREAARATLRSAMEMSPTPEIRARLELLLKKYR